MTEDAGKLSPAAWRKWLLPIKATVSIGLLAFLVSRLDWEDVRQLPAITPLLLVFSLGINIGALALMTGRWRILLRAATGRDVAYSSLFRYYLVGAFYNNLLPGSIGGDVLRTKRLSDNHDIARAPAIRVTVTERLIGLGGVMFLASATAPWAPLPPSWSEAIGPWREPATIIAGITSVLVIIALLFTLRRQRLGLGALASVGLLVVLAQMTDAIIILLFFLSMDVWTPPTALVFAVSASYLAAMLPISLGGLGVKESVLTALLLLAGAPMHAALLVPLMLTLTRLLTGTVGAVIDLRSRA